MFFSVNFWIPENLIFPKYRENLSHPWSNQVWTSDSRYSFISWDNDRTLADQNSVISETRVTSPGCRPGQWYIEVMS